MSQLQHRNENQNVISNFAFQFTIKTKWHFRYTDSHGLSDTQPAFTCSKLTIETLEQGVKYVQS